MRRDGAEVPAGLSVSSVLWLVARHPVTYLARRWNYKSAVASSICRATLFFVTNLSAGLTAAAGAFSTEFWLRFLTAGFYGALTQAFRRAEPPGRAMLAAVVVLPLTAHTIELAVHSWTGTPHLWASLAVSIAFTVGSTAFNVYAMRHGAFIVGTGARSLVDDVRRVPALLAGFAGWLWHGGARA